jgi:hypothetical protein
MGRGISDLQKRILSIVYKRRQGRDFVKEGRERHDIVASNRLLQGFRLEATTILGTLRSSPNSMTGRRRTRRGSMYVPLRVRPSRTGDRTGIGTLSGWPSTTARRRRTTGASLD